MPAVLDYDRARLESICRAAHIAEVAMFGSVLREDFRPGSDIDLLVTFDPAARVTLFDLAAINEEFEALFGRKVDVVSRRGIEAGRNYLRRREILDSARVIYGAAIELLQNRIPPDTVN